MAQDDPFTLDLFGNTALSCGLGLGVAAFAGGLTVEPGDDDDPDPSTPAHATRVAAAAVLASSARHTRGANFDLAGDRALAKGWKDRAHDNIAAIRLAAAIEVDERAARRAIFSGAAHAQRAVSYLHSLQPQAKCEQEAA